MADDNSLIEGLDELEQFNRQSRKNEPLNLRGSQFEQRNVLEPQVKSSMMRATQTDPQSAVKDNQLSKESGIPPEAFDYDREYMERMAKFKARYPLASEARPATYKWLSDPHNSAVGIDDIQAFDKLEKQLRDALGEPVTLLGRPLDYVQSFGAGAVRSLGGSLEGLGGTLEALGTEKEFDWFDFTPSAGSLESMPVIGGFATILGGIFDTATGGKGAMLEGAMREEAKELLGFDPIFISDETAVHMRATGMFGQDLGQKVNNVAEMIDIAESKKAWDTEVAGALGMMGTQIGMTLLARPLALAQMYGLGANEQMQRMEQAGTDPRAEELIKGGVITALLEKAGIDVLLNRLPPMVKGKVMNWFADLTIAGGAEFAEELAENVAHNALEMTYNEDKELLDVDFKELTVAGGAGFIMRALLRASGNRAFKMNQNKEQIQLDEIIDNIKNTQTNDLDPDVTASHIQAVMDQYGLDSDLYVDAEGLSEVLGKLNQSMPVVQAMQQQLQEALDVGGDVVVPAKDVLSHMIKDGQIETLRPHIRLRQDSLTLNELDQMTVERRQEVNKILEQGIQESQMYNEAKAIEADVASQLFETGRMSKRDARISSKILSARVMRVAETEGMTPSEVYEDLGLIVKTRTDRSRIATKNGIMYNQNFDDTKLKETIMNAETGKRAEMEVDAQVLWDEEVKNSKNLQSLLECVNG